MKILSETERDGYKIFVVEYENAKSSIEAEVIQVDLGDGLKFYNTSSGVECTKKMIEAILSRDEKEVRKKRGERIKEIRLG